MPIEVSKELEAEMDFEIMPQRSPEAVVRGADLLVTVGSLAEHLRAGALEAGLRAEATRHFPCAEEAAAALPAILLEGDLVLVKASRGVGLERVVDAIAGERR